MSARLRIEALRQPLPLFWRARAKFGAWNKDLPLLLRIVRINDPEMACEIDVGPFVRWQKLVARERFGVRLWSRVPRLLVALDKNTIDIEKCTGTRDISNEHRRRRRKMFERDDFTSNIEHRIRPSARRDEEPHRLHLEMNR